MAINRSLLHMNSLDEFAEWAAKRGYERQPVKGAYEVLRLHRPASGRTRKVTLVYYQRQNGLTGMPTQHASVGSEDAYRLAKKFVYERKNARRKAAARLEAGNDVLGSGEDEHEGGGPRG